MFEQDNISKENQINQITTSFQTECHNIINQTMHNKPNNFAYQDITNVYDNSTTTKNNKISI